MANACERFFVIGYYLIKYFVDCYFGPPTFIYSIACSIAYMFFKHINICLNSHALTWTFIMIKRQRTDPSCTDEPAQYRPVPLQSCSTQAGTANSQQLRSHLLRQSSKHNTHLHLNSRHHHGINNTSPLFPNKELYTDSWTSIGLQVRLLFSS